MNKGFIFNTDRCAGCHACIIACSNQNDVSPGNKWRSVYQYNENGFPAIQAFFHSLACHHCEDAPCMTHCPANAFYRDPVTNAVLVDQKKCIGCKYCTWACPFDAPEYNPIEKIIGKCTLCMEKVKTGDIPACAKCCPTGALEFSELDPSSPFDPVMGFSDYGIGPKIQFVSAGKKERIPEMAGRNQMPEKTVSLKNDLPEPLPRVSLASEWSLALFTFFVPLIIGMFAGTIKSQHGLSNELFLLFGFFTLLVSLFHIGKKKRFYRAILNLKSSWLSREILFFLLFFGISSFTIITGFSSLLFNRMILLLGLLTTFSIDRVYHLQTLVNKNYWHSSQTLLTTMLFVSIFLESFFPFIFILVLKLLLYIYRKVEYKRMKKDPRWIISLLRIFTAIASPLWFFVMGPQTSWLFILISASLSEFIDRIEFYLELDYITPEQEFKNRLIEDLKRAG